MTIVLDSSIIIGILKGEPGSEAWLNEDSQHHLLSAVNLQEILAKTFRFEMDLRIADALIDRLQLTIFPHDAEQARAAASLWPIARQYGLSLGDRSCLALAQLKGAPVLTADRVWAGLDVGVDIRLVR